MCVVGLGIAHTGTEGRVGAKADGSRLGPQPEYDDSFTLNCVQLESMSHVLVVLLELSIYVCFVIPEGA